VLIERIQVEEGFLDGIDIELQPGLNVLIGGRGTGKTSVIELVRFCLGIEGHTVEIDRRAREHALSILEGGRVTVTLNDGGDHVTVSRSSGDKQPRATRRYSAPLIFSQTEIELLGLEHSGRLRMIDDFLADDTSIFQSGISANSGVARSYTAEIRNLAKEVEALEEQIRDLPVLREQLTPVLEEERNFARLSKELLTKQQTMNQATALAAVSSIKQKLLEQLITQTEHWLYATQRAVEAAPRLDAWPDDAASVSLRTRLEAMVNEGKKQLHTTGRHIESVISAAQRALADAEIERGKQAQTLREIRTTVEQLKGGAGAISKKASELRQRIAGLESTQKQIEARLARIKGVRSKRRDVLDQLAALYSSRYLQRKRVAQDLEKRLAPRIKISIAQAADVTHYTEALVVALRGSSIRYNELAPYIAKRISPRELVEAVEDNNIEFIVEAADLNRERVQRIVAQLKESKLEDILLAEIDDEVSLQLLDGSDYKELDYLSTGQRCTVVLPIVLQHRNRTLVVDQPEDHLDNGFIVDTLIKVLRDRRKNSQMLIATHNANIPVLGEAERVLVMGSDGRRGFIQHTGALDDPESVAAITNLMEGGREAFEARARFYKKHVA